jgi:uncharacterized membrane protein YgcG
MLGRLELRSYEPISRAWLEKNLLVERPEVVGAMWDSTVGAAEVSAVLARMVAEGRIQSSTASGVMELTLLNREGANDYEQALIDGFFFDGDYTNTGMIRRHYEKSGFNPASLISPGINELVQERLPKGNPAKPSAIVPGLLFLAVIAALVHMVLQNRDLLIAAIVGGVASLVICAFTTIAPEYWRVRKSLGIVSAFASMIPATIVTVVLGLLIWNSANNGVPELTFEMQLALTAIALWIFATAVHTLRSRESREAIAFRKMLGAARNYFRQELRKEHPALDDSWYPYILAFGLDKDVAKWFKSFPGATTSRSHESWRSSSSPASSSSSVASWSGGGGAFGGAGATGTWAVAAAGMAVGVAAPSSSSGSSGSSSGGGSSGGGGGGGW